MPPLTLHALAKINLHLHITGRRDDGYHTLDSLVAFTNLYDTIQIRDGISYHLNILNSPECPADNNLVTRATYLIANHFNIEPNICIDLTKNIPMGSGLGGGSADAAAIFLALRNFWKLDAPNTLLEKLASEIGSDIVACLQTKPMIMRDTGNTLLTAPKFPTLYGVLVTPQTPCPTALVYKKYAEQKLELSKNVAFPYSFESSRALCHFLDKNTQNDLTSAAIAINPDVEMILKELKNLDNGLLTRLSGSGSSCYTIFENETTAINQTRIIQSKNPEWIIKTIKVMEKNFVSPLICA